MPQRTVKTTSLLTIMSKKDIESDDNGCKYSLNTLLTTVCVLGAFSLGIYLVVYGCDTLPVYRFNCQTDSESLSSNAEGGEYIATGDVSCNQTFDKYLLLKFTNVTLYRCRTILCRDIYTNLYLSSEGWEGWSYSPDSQPFPDELQEKSVSRVWCFMGIIAVVLSGISISLCVCLICCTIYRKHVQAKKTRSTAINDIEGINVTVDR